MPVLLCLAFWGKCLHDRQEQPVFLFLVLGQLIERHEVRVGLRRFVLDGAVLPAVCDQPVIPSLVILLRGPLWVGQRFYDRRDVLPDLVLRRFVP